MTVMMAGNNVICQFKKKLKNKIKKQKKIPKSSTFGLKIPLGIQEMVSVDVYYPKWFLTLN